MELQFNRLLIFDGSHALHRAICEPHLWEMRNHNGDKTGGIYGVIQTIIKESATYNYYPVVVFDGHLSQRRLEIYDNYKRHADKQLLQECVEELSEAELLEMEHRREYNTQREILKKILPAMGIPVLHLEHWEGDDIIYLLTQITKDSIVVSDDKDLIQLVCDTPERRCRVRRGMRDEFIDIKYLADNCINQNEFVACKAIVGDASDNIPSACFQVGEKTALPLYKIYQSCVANATSFPQDENSLGVICKQLGLSKRKAYLNFNEEQFLKNLLLMDLALVEQDASSELISNLVNMVTEMCVESNGNLVSDILNYLEIRTINFTNLYNRLDKTRALIPIISSSLECILPDINKPKVGKLF